MTDDRGSKHFQDSEDSEWQERFPDNKVAVGITRTWSLGGGVLKPDDVPQILHYRGKLPIRDSFISKNGMLLVRDKIRAVIESLDPGQHQFFPVTFKRARKDMDIEPYFLMNIWRYQDTIIDELSEVHPNEFSPNDRNVMSFKGFGGPITLVIDSTKLGPLNMWRERRFKSKILMSDAMHDAFEAAGVKFFSTWRAHMQEVVA